MYITTEAGTYIKVSLLFLFISLSLSLFPYSSFQEFVHGDFGRTAPSVASLLSRTIDILALDVMHVTVEFPPQDYDTIY